MERFDVLRREATKLERNLEDKIARYHQLAQRLATGTDSYDTPTRNHSSLLSSAEDGTLPSSHQTNVNNNNTPRVTSDEETALASDIQRTLTTLSDLINTQMAPIAESNQKSQHLLLVKRYREILFDSTADFQKVGAGIARRRDAEELFAGRTTNGIGSGGADERDPAMEQLLRERNAIGNSLNSAKSVLGQASEVRSALSNQGNALRGVGGKIKFIASNVPGLNSLIENIRRKRGRDDAIVSSVIAFCILFTLWYIFH